MVVVTPGQKERIGNGGSIGGIMIGNNNNSICRFSLVTAACVILMAAHVSSGQELQEIEVKEEEVGGEEVQGEAPPMGELQVLKLAEVNDDVIPSKIHEGLPPVLRSGNVVHEQSLIPSAAVKSIMDHMTSRAFWLLDNETEHGRVFVTQEEMRTVKGFSVMAEALSNYFRIKKDIYIRGLEVEMIYYKGDMSTHPDCCLKHLDSSASPDGSEHGCPRMLSGLVYLNDIDSRKNGGRTIFIGRDSRAYEPSEGGALLFSNFKWEGNM